MESILIVQKVAGGLCGSTRECTQVQLKVIQVVSYVILRRHIFWKPDAFYPLLLITAGASI